LSPHLSTLADGSDGARQMPYPLLLAAAGSGHNWALQSQPMPSHPDLHLKWAAGIQDCPGPEVSGEPQGWGL
jgi:hypothetical protein